MQRQILITQTGTSESRTLLVYFQRLVDRAEASLPGVHDAVAPEPDQVLQAPGGRRQAAEGGPHPGQADLPHHRGSGNVPLNPGLITISFIFHLTFHNQG